VMQRIEFLMVHRVLSQEDSRNCVLRHRWEEASNHIFLHCTMAFRVWSLVFRWIGIGIVAPPSLFMQLECVIEAARNKRLKKGYRLIWHTVVWVL
jgi:hypothetical protein